MLLLWEPTLWAMVCRACAMPIAHGVGSYNNFIMQNMYALFEIISESWENSGII
jgi:hypothetical protein